MTERFSRAAAVAAGSPTRFLPVGSLSSGFVRCIGAAFIEDSRSWSGVSSAVPYSFQTDSGMLVIDPFTRQVPVRGSRVTEKVFFCPFVLSSPSIPNVSTQKSRTKATGIQGEEGVAVISLGPRRGGSASVSLRSSPPSRWVSWARASASSLVPLCSERNRSRNARNLLRPSVETGSLPKRSRMRSGELRCKSSRRARYSTASGCLVTRSAYRVVTSSLMPVTTDRAYAASQPTPLRIRSSHRWGSPLSRASRAAHSTPNVPSTHPGLILT
jgi:hypothetical protein